MHKHKLLFLFVLGHLHAMAQSFTATGGAIPDDGNSVVFEIEVSNLPSATNATDFGLESVCINVTHSWVADLSVTLIAPNGQLLNLFNGIGGDTDGFVNTCFNGNSTESIFSVWYPFTGTFSPFGDMGLFNKGLDPNGTWKLRILDTYAFADAGDLLDWTITFGNQPCVPFPFESSDLPIVKIETEGQYIPNDPKITAQFQLIDNGPGQRNYADQTTYAYEGTIGIELRGNSSQGMPKKPYSVEFRDSLGNDKAVSILGLPEESDFVLQANFSDKTQIRNALSFQTFRNMGRYASRTRFCELLIDGNYMGIYTLVEDIKRDKNRVDIAKLTETDLAGTDLTGGYILRIDWDRTPGWSSQFEIPGSPGFFAKFQHVYPKWDKIQPVQQDYISAYVDSFEVALAGNNFDDPNAGWRQFADEASFIDYLLLNEISRNVDGYRLSTYFYKDKGGKLTMGPPWDYDLAWYNADYCDGFLTSGWAYDLNDVCGGGEKNVPFWWPKLATDALFAQNMACRWQSLRNGVLSEQQLFATIDSTNSSRQKRAISSNGPFWASMCGPTQARCPPPMQGRFKK
jgi:subtilisin-like proprotein convertase family protein